MKIAVLFFLLSIGLFAVCQETSYKDVAVIVNDNSPTSIDIGNYFQLARNIPDQNMIHVLAPITEEIDSLQFEQVRAQIENHLTANNLIDSINYIVTTKGVPLKIESDCFYTEPSGFSEGFSCASFDSELTLIYSPDTSQIGMPGAVNNPVYNTTNNFLRDSLGVYLVTRLDGYTKEDVYNLIDRSGPTTGVNQVSAQAIIDLNATTGGDSLYHMNNFLEPTYDYLTGNFWNAQLDPNFDPLLDQENVFAYIYGGHGPLINVSLDYGWTKGSIAVLSTCKTAVTFEDSLNSFNYFLIGDLIAEGCTGGHGNVDCIYLSQILNSETLVSRYFDPVENYNLAESFYMAEPNLSWQGVIIGDPKSSVVIDNLATINEVEIKMISIFPNPSTGGINVSSSDLITSISVYDMKGELVKNYDQLMSNSVVLDLQEVSDGIYILQVEIGSELIQERVVINK